MPSERRVHRYHVHASWAGSTGDGYRAYDRSHHVVTTPSTVGLRVSADPAFRGDPALLNPEQLVVAAASSCQLMSFLAAAALAHVDIVSYEDDAEGEMPEERPIRIARITLHPHVVVRGEVTEERVRELLEVGHHECFIANSLNTEIVVEPTIEIVA